MELQEIPTRRAPDLDVPQSFSRLMDIVYNLWWSWSPEALSLFSKLSSSAWRRYRNPIDLLIDVGPERWRAVTDDDEFTRTYHALVARFDAYMNPSRPTWFQENSRNAGGPFAYFSTEFGWHECLQIYSGGLGVLSGDHCKSASDLGLPMIGVGLMYQHGYFSQTIDADGHQQHFYPDYDMLRLPLLLVVDSRGNELQVPVPFPDRTVVVRVWRASVGRVPVLLLDTDLPINHPADRQITSMLYVRGREMRLCQEIVLGMGGVATLRALGIEPRVWHINEGHSALLALERMRETMLARQIDARSALQRVASTTVFTTHTPVPAGNETFDVSMVRKYLGGWCETHGIDFDYVAGLAHAGAETADGFNLTALAIRSSARCNGVSKLHGEVANSMWSAVIEEAGRPAIEHVTNGVHVASWVGPEMGELLQRNGAPALDDGLLDDSFAEALARIPDYELWTAHLAQKRRLIALVRERTQLQYARHGHSPDELRDVAETLDPDVLTVGFARRFATYKRADLLLSDIERLEALVGAAEHPVQFLFAGKAHPADRPGQEIIRRICEATRRETLRGRVVFMENYDMRVGRHLVQGVDLWMNTPRRPLEASGTSGMKAAVNGVLNCSILDGWWCEGHDPSHGWALDAGDAAGNEAEQDRRDVDKLYRVLAEEIVPAYYGRNEHGLPAAWIGRMRSAIERLVPRFSSTRMVHEYAERFYLPAARGEL